MRQSPDVDKLGAGPARVRQPLLLADEALVRVALKLVRPGDLAHVLRPLEVVRLERVGRDGADHVEVACGNEGVG